MLYLDTNAYSALANGNKKIIKLLQAEHGLTIPLPVIAELRYGFIKGSQREKNESNLQRFLAQPQIEVALPTIKTTSLYSELQFHCAKKGKTLSHNDLWIASLAKEGRGTLLTYDRDFTALSDIFSEQLIILTLD